VKEKSAQGVDSRFHGILRSGLRARGKFDFLRQSERHAFDARRRAVNIELLVRVEASGEDFQRVVPVERMQQFSVQRVFEKNDGVELPEIIRNEAPSSNYGIVFFP
jgi:hypothetical protein